MFFSLTLFNGECVNLFTVNLHRVFPVALVRDVALKPLNDGNPPNSLQSNASCEQCLCDLHTSGTFSSYLALNCFPSNNPCQFFAAFPQTYKLSALEGARLFLLQNRFPDASSCWMPNMTTFFLPSVLGYDEANLDELALIGRYGDVVY